MKLVSAAQSEELPMVTTYEATISSDGGVVIPEELLRQLGVEVGGSIQFVLQDDRSVIVRTGKRTIDSVRGSVAPIPGTSEDFDEEIEQAWMDEVERKHGAVSRT